MPPKTAKFKHALKSSAARLRPRQASTTSTSTSTSSSSPSAPPSPLLPTSPPGTESATPTTAGTPVPITLPAPVSTSTTCVNANASLNAGASNAGVANNSNNLAMKRRSTRRGLRISSKLGKARIGLGIGIGIGIGNGRGTGRDAISPVEGERPVVVLRVQVVGCSGLLAKDRNGFSDPFVTLSLPPHPTRHSTPVIKRSLSPSFPAAQSTFEFPIYLSTAERLGVLECVVWDKDFLVGDKIGMGRKEYLGEVGVGVEEWFVKGCSVDLEDIVVGSQHHDVVSVDLAAAIHTDADVHDHVESRAPHREMWRKERDMGWDEEGNRVFSLPLLSTRTNTDAKGSILLKIGFVKTEMGVGFEEVYDELVRRSRPSLVSAPPTEGVGTVRSSRSRVYPTTGDFYAFEDAAVAVSTSASAAAAAGAPGEEGNGGVHDGVAEEDGEYMFAYQYQDDGGLSSDEEDDYAEEGNGMIDKEDRSFVQVSEGETEESEESESEEESDYYDDEGEGEEVEEGEEVLTPTLPGSGLSPALAMASAQRFSSEPEAMESSLQFQQERRAPLPPSTPVLNLTPASPEVTPTSALGGFGNGLAARGAAAGGCVNANAGSPRSATLGSVPTVPPASTINTTGNENSTTSTSVSPLTLRSTTAVAGSKSSSPSASGHGLSGMLPRMKFTKRSLSSNAGVGVRGEGSCSSFGYDGSLSAGGSGTGLRCGSAQPTRMTFDLTEDVPRIGVGVAKGKEDGEMVKEKEKEKEKKGRFRRSWSAGVRRASLNSGSGSGSGSTCGSGSGSTSTSSGGEGVPASVNLDAASQAAQGGVGGVGVKGKKGKRKGKSEDGMRKGKKGKKGKVQMQQLSDTATGEGVGAGTTKVKAKKGKGKKVTGKGKGKREYRFGGGDNDVVGIVMLEIDGAKDLPKLKNMTRTGWDMDPFVVISFGKKVFRTRVIRHSLNPSWDEKLLFHVRRYETNFKVQLTVLDWDKLSSNDYIGECEFGVAELIEKEGKGVDPETGLYPLEDVVKGEGGRSEMREFRMPLKTAKEMPWEAKHNPVITFRAKYQPYAELRQRFWFQYMKQYDTDDTGTLSHIEITSMLDSLGSTLTKTTINSFFERFGKRPFEEELTIREVIQCLEMELGRPVEEKKRVAMSGTEDEGEGTSVCATPVLMLADRRGKELSLDELDFSGPPLSAMVMPASGLEGLQRVYETEPAQQVLGSAAAGATPSSSAATTPSMEYTDRSLGGSSSSDADADGEMDEEESSSGSPVAEKGTARKKGYGFKKDVSGSVSDSYLAPPTTSASVSFAPSAAFPPSSSSTPALSSTRAAASEDSVERVINVKNCPLCHRPRLSSKAEVDIVTHLAVCASQDWNKVDRIVVGNFVTASQAQRKWYTRILSKVSSGDYKLGANSANIIVQNRLTGQLEEEKMQVYVRLGIRLLYKGMQSRMEGGRARRLLKSLSIKQGIKYDSPESARDIPAFVQFHGLNMAEVRDPLESFKTFNEFFYRKLKDTARPVDSPEDPYRLVSAADCRFMAFESVSEATRLWIKGREFTVARLLGDAYQDQVERYNGGALAIFRLAPQDYHRFHSPVDGRIGKMTYISGEYYTVNPQAIRTALDVYGENARKIVPIDSPQFGRVMAVCIGAMMVGTIKTTVEEGQYVRRGEEFGYFAFGGSTIVILFEKGVVEWDEDLLINGRAALETLVRVGMGIGAGTRKP